MSDVLTADEVRRIGLNLCGFDDERQDRVCDKKNRERFHAHYGTSPLVVAVIWEDLLTTDLEAASVDPEEDGTCIDHLFWALCFLKCYPVENVAEGSMKVCDKTFCKWVWFYIRKLCALRKLKIVMPKKWRTRFIFSVDGVHCPLNEPMHGEYSKNPAFMSHKFRSAGLDYEIAIDIFNNNCIWCNGPYRAGKNDISVFRDKLIHEIPLGKLVVADLGYRGERSVVATPSSHDTKEVREFKSRSLAKHEKFNGKVKNFKSVSGRFRHGIKKHGLCFHAAVVVCQHQLENGSPLDPV